MFTLTGYRSLRELGRARGAQPDVSRVVARARARRTVKLPYGQNLKPLVAEARKEKKERREGENGH